MMKRTILLLFAALCGALTAAAQDLIVKTDATKIEAKVIEITPEAVRYKRFSNPDGPTYVLPVKEIHYISGACVLGDLGMWPLNSRRSLRVLI